MADMDRIKSTLMLQKGFANARCIALACSVRGEGCTSVARSLAAQLVRDNGQKVLLIDACVRHPELHKLAKIALSPGLTDVLAGRLPVAELGAAAKPHTVAILPAGILTDQDLTPEWSAQLRRALTQLAQYYSRIIIDAGAVVTHPEASLSVASADACILVVREGGPREAIVREARRRLDQAQPNILGVVLNRARRVIPTWLYRKL